jgi:O-antigen/teichoic acid export membrane protein
VLTSTTEDRAPAVGLRSFAATVVSTASTRAALVPLALATSILTARVLGPHDRGVLSLLTTMAATLTVLSRLGIYSANIYMIRHERRDPSAVTSNALVFASLLGALGVGGALLAARSGMAGALGETGLLLLVLALAVVPLELSIAYARSVLHALHRFGADNARTLAGALLSLVATFVALVVFQAGLVGALAVTLGTAAVMACWLVSSVRRACRGFGRLDPGLLGATLRYGVKSYVQTLASFLHRRLDVYLLALYLSPEHVAYYAIASRVGEMTLLVPETVGQVFFPRAAARTAPAQGAETAAVLRHVLVLSGVIAVAVFLAGELLIVGLYGEAYAPAVAALGLMLPGYVMTALLTIVNRDLMARNKQQVNIAGNVVALAANVGLNVLLIPRWGIAGAALASTLSFSLAAVALMAFFLRETRSGLGAVLRFTASDVRYYRALLERLRRRARRASR